MALNKFYFWNKYKVIQIFKGDVTPPKITFVRNQLTTNSTAEIEWKIDEPVVNTTCVLTKPNQPVEIFDCVGQWSTVDLTEGIYSLSITTVDLEGNSARVTHSWTVGTNTSVNTDAQVFKELLDYIYSTVILNSLT